MSFPADFVCILVFGARKVRGLQTKIYRNLQQLISALIEIFKAAISVFRRSFSVFRQLASPTKYTEEYHMKKVFWRRLQINLNEVTVGPKN